MEADYPAQVVDSLGIRRTLRSHRLPAYLIFNIANGEVIHVRAQPSSPHFASTSQPQLLPVVHGLMQQQRERGDSKPDCISEHTRRANSWMNAHIRGEVNTKAI
ncbi:hypothetical protein CBL_07967 [Carabus blaptoides fortunei]